VDSSPLVKKEWVLTREAFTKLLACLDADEERAGEKYEDLRLMLMKFFDWRGASFPEECADETLNRAARKLEEGEAIRDLTTYCYGVARLVFLETLKQPESRHEPLDDLDLAADPPEEDAGEQHRLECFQGCLRSLPDESRTVILRYYQEEKRSKINNRLALATSLGIPLNALRSRAQRIREKLEQCVTRCLKKK
jgi:DNA-directed RNA polymerase specialized sigma24 family protein